MLNSLISVSIRRLLLSMVGTPACFVTNCLMPTCLVFSCLATAQPVNAQTVNAQATNVSTAYGQVDTMPTTPLFVDTRADYSTVPYQAGSYQAPTDQPIRLAQNQTDVVPDSSSLKSNGLSPIAPPSPAERGFFQGLEVSAAWAPQSDDDKMGQTSASLAVKLGMPAPLIGGPLLVTPKIGMHILDGPNLTDVPARLNDLQVSFATFRQINPQWMVTASVGVGTYADDYSLDSGDAVRVSGMALAMYEQSPTVKWMFGAAATSQGNFPVIPLVGVIIDHETVRYDITLPNPRVTWRLPSYRQHDQRTVYLGGDLDGGTWAVQRANGQTQTMNFNNFGLLAGYERNQPGVGKLAYELGWRFEREIEFEETGEEFDLGDTLFARINFSY